MRIASVYLPSFPLQVALRNHPALHGEPVAVIGRNHTVLVCSKAAWALGVRPGVELAAAVALAPGLVTLPRDLGAEQRTLEALAEALLAHAERVDLGGEPAVNHALYAAAPARARGSSVGARLAEVAAAQGLRARVGVADDRFTAWAAAAWHPEGVSPARVVSVPRGGSAAFLAPLPLTLLAIGPEVRGLLAAVGVRTLGEFAALPPPSVSHRHAAVDDAGGDYQALARGDGGAALTPFSPAGALVERVVRGGGPEAPGLGAGLALLAQRFAGRLAGRGHAAAAIAVVGDGGRRIVELPTPTADARDLADALGPAAEEVAGAGGWLALELERRDAGFVSDGVPTPIPEEASVPVAVVEAAPFSLRVPEPPMRLAPREPHRRTQRGKRRERVAGLGQARLCFER